MILALEPLGCRQLSSSVSRTFVRLYFPKDSMVGRLRNKNEAPFGHWPSIDGRLFPDGQKDVRSAALIGTLIG